MCCSKCCEYWKYEKPKSGCLLSFAWDARKIDTFIRALDFGNYENPLGLPKIEIENNWSFLYEFKSFSSPFNYTARTYIYT